jgi:hypothetical protein
MERQVVQDRERQFSEDIGIRDVKFALTGIGICVAIALLLMIIG